MNNQIKTAVILAAGKGNRLAGVVDDIPKPMININGRPILEHNLLSLKNIGVTNIYLNLHQLPEVIKNYFGNGEKFGVKITYSFEPELLGTAGALNNFRPYLSEKPFMLIYGDNLINFDLVSLINFHVKKDGLAALGLYYREEVHLSGVVETSTDGLITRFVEKPLAGSESSHWVNTGVYVLAPKILDYIPSAGRTDFGKDLFPGLIKKGEKLYGLKVNGQVIPIDTPKLLEIARGE